MKMIDRMQELAGDVPVRLLFLDVDGTLTDGKIYMGPDGEAMKAFDIKDGYALANILPEHGILPVIITARASSILLNRCRELHITEIYQNCRDKRQKMLEIAGSYGLEPGENGILPGTAYIGDDVLDIQCMEIARYKGCPADAVREVQEIADFISSRSGGCGAVREFIEWLTR